MTSAHAHLTRSSESRPFQWLIWALVIWAVISVMLLLVVSAAPTGGSLNVDWLHLRQQIVHELTPPAPVQPSRQVADPAPAQR